MYDEDVALMGFGGIAIGGFVLNWFWVTAIMIALVATGLLITRLIARHDGG